MISGVFQVGETVIGKTATTGIVPLDTGNSNSSITFRVAKANHKEGQIILHQIFLQLIHIMHKHCRQHIHQHQLY
jgi:hypothetical protein